VSEDQKLFWMGFAAAVVIAVALMVAFRLFGGL
jgi:hypothetical protein